MSPCVFPQANIQLGKPEDLDESQCESIPAFSGQMVGGNLDGSHLIVVAWKPSEDDLKRLVEGSPIFLTCIGGCPPHFMSATFPFDKTI